MKRTSNVVVLGGIAVVCVAYLGFNHLAAGSGPADRATDIQAAPPAVTVVKVERAEIQETVMLTGTLVPRLEILVAPEVEGLRVVELIADEGDRVEKGQVLARLETESLKAQLAQNDASLARAQAAIAQAKIAIVSAEARDTEARKALERGNSLKPGGSITEAVLDQRESAARVATASLRSARAGLPLAEADLALIEAQRRDLDWKLSRTDVKTPVGGIVNRRASRIGGVASGTAVAEPMFRIIADGEIELEAEVPEVDVARLAAGQTATLTLADGTTVAGVVRLVSPEVDKTSRQGKVRVALRADAGPHSGTAGGDAQGKPRIGLAGGDAQARLRIGSFARGAVATRSSNGLVVPAAAVMHGAEGPFVMLLEDRHVVARPITTGLETGERIEVPSGLAEGSLVVAKAGTFLRDGDQITPVGAAAAPATVSPATVAPATVSKVN